MVDGVLLHETDVFFVGPSRLARPVYREVKYRHVPPVHQLRDFTRSRLYRPPSLKTHNSSPSGLYTLSNIRIQASSLLNKDTQGQSAILLIANMSASSALPLARSGFGLGLSQ